MLCAAHCVRESAHEVTGTAHVGGSSTFRWASWADWAGSGVEGHLSCDTLRMRRVGLSCHDTAAGPVGASSDRTEGLGDAIRNYDPSGGTGRLKSTRPDFPAGEAPDSKSCTVVGRYVKLSPTFRLTVRNSMSQRLLPYSLSTACGGAAASVLEPLRSVRRCSASYACCYRLLLPASDQKRPVIGPQMPIHAQIRGGEAGIRTLGPLGLRFSRPPQ